MIFQTYPVTLDDPTSPHHDQPAPGQFMVRLSEVSQGEEVHTDCDVLERSLEPFGRQPGSRTPVCFWLQTPPGCDITWHVGAVPPEVEFAQWDSDPVWWDKTRCSQSCSQETPCGRRYWGRNPPYSRGVGSRRDWGSIPDCDGLGRRHKRASAGSGSTQTKAPRAPRQQTSGTSSRPKDSTRPTTFPDSRRSAYSGRRSTDHGPRRPANSVPRTAVPDSDGHRSRRHASYTYTGRQVRYEYPDASTYPKTQAEIIDEILEDDRRRYEDVRYSHGEYSYTDTAPRPTHHTYYRFHTSRRPDEPRTSRRTGFHRVDRNEPSARR